MTIISKNVNRYRTYVTKARQLIPEGSNTVDAQKMQAKEAVLSQWRLVNHVKNYLSKYYNENIVENTLNKEFAHFLQKIQPSIYGTDLWKYVESLALPKSQENESCDNKKDDQSSAALINGLRRIITSNSVVKTAVIPKWKKGQLTTVTKIPTAVTTHRFVWQWIPLSVGIYKQLTGLAMGSPLSLILPECCLKNLTTKLISTIPLDNIFQGIRTLTKYESVISGTCELITSIKNAPSDEELLNRINNLNTHINKHPEAKHIAVKEGAISFLLKIKQKTTNNQLLECLNEAFALLGYAHPVLGNGIRILSIDGGGVRGILVIEMLKKLEELSGKRIHEMFDLICGVSTGAIIASLVGVRQYSLDDITEIYKKLSTQIFTQSALRGTSSLVWSHSYYDTALWEKLLKEQIGDQTLISTSRNLASPKLCALSAVVNQSRVSAYVFRNYTFPYKVQSQYIGGHKHLIWQAVRASAAAPTYFEEFKLGNMLHQDGGILFNNPTAVAIHEAKLIWPETPFECVISFGTGRTVPLPIDGLAETAMTVSNSSWKSKFYAIIESATDTEGVHSMLSDLLPPDVYYRFNPYLTEMLDIAEIDSNKLKQLELDAIMYLRRNEDKFQGAAEILKRKKRRVQKVKDWLNIQKEIYGVKMPY